MTDLTEQWKKRKIRNGAYYIKLLGGDILPAFCNTEYILKQFQTMKGIYSDVAEVLAPVPSYDEWKKFIDANTSLFDSVKMLEKDNFRLEKQNAELKDLLKECESSIQYYQETYGAMDLDTYTLLAKLKEVLNE